VYEPRRTDHRHHAHCQEGREGQRHRRWPHPPAKGSGQAPRRRRDEPREHGHEARDHPEAGTDERRQLHIAHPHSVGTGEGGHQQQATHHRGGPGHAPPRRVAAHGADDPGGHEGGCHHNVGHDAPADVRHHRGHEGDQQHDHGHARTV